MAFPQCLLMLLGKMGKEGKTDKVDMTVVVGKGVLMDQDGVRR